MRKTPKPRLGGLIPLHFRYSDLYGLPRRKTVYGKTLKEAERKKTDFLSSVRAGIRIEQAGRTVSSWADEWLEVYKKPSVTIRTYETYAHDIELIKQAIGHKPLKAVTSSDIIKIVNSRAGLSASAIKKTLMTVKALFNAAIENRMIGMNPCTGVKRVPGTVGTHRALDEAEVTAVLRAARNHRFGAVAALMLLAGLRKAEAAAFNFDTDMVDGKVFVRRSLTWPSNQAVVKLPKSKAGIREVPILSPLEFYAKPGLAIEGGNEYISEVGFRRAHESFVKACGVNFRCHDLRHTFTTLIYDAGVDLKTAQKWLGHDDPTVTLRIYTHLSESRDKASSEGAEAYFQNQVAVKMAVNS